MNMDLDTVLPWILISLPEIIVLTAATLLLLLDLVLRGPGRGVVLARLAIGIVAVAAFTSWTLAGTTALGYSELFVIDDFATFFKMVLYLATWLVILLSIDYLRIEGSPPGEYYALLLYALAGMLIMVSAADLITIYVGLELMSLSVYVLVGFRHRDPRSTEAAIKYLILGGLATAILLYGVSLGYGLTGTTQLADFATALRGEASGEHDPFLVLATVLMLSGFVFKVAAVPFHMWAPDVYEGAPTSITAYLSVAPKAAAFAVILRVLYGALPTADGIWLLLVTVIAVATLAIGTFVALVQSNIKRMLAYSSIAHAGYALLGIVAGGVDGMASVMFYLLIYAFMNLGIFAAVILMHSNAVRSEAIDDYQGLNRNHPGLALLMLIFLFSLAGIPPTAGFFAKFYIFFALIDTGHVALAVIAVLMSVVAAYFYLRIVMLIYMREPEQAFAIATPRPVRIALAVAVAGTLLLGVLPAWFLDLARNSTLALT